MDTVLRTEKGIFVNIQKAVKFISLRDRSIPLSLVVIRDKMINDLIRKQNRSFNALNKFMVRIIT